jgi:poly(3-hydroxybutyrate) depolymerase
MSGFRVSARLIGLTLFFAAPGIAPASAQGDTPPLGAYNAGIKESSISGISSGAFMAVQFGVSWSSAVKGVGVIAGGPYYCAQGTAAEGLTGNLLPDLMATGPCMKGPPPALGPLFEKADEWARRGDIDDLRNIAHQQIYIFSGYNDAVVNPKVGDSAYQFYFHYVHDQSKGSLFYQNAIGAGHSQVTMDYGLACADNKDYFIDKCNYDQAGILLQQIYGALNPKNKGGLSGKLVAFNQREFTFPESPGSYSMAETGYVYVPAACAAQQPCRVHVALHGCKQNFDAVGDRYTRHAGYNEWADTNQLIILYPQTIAGNPLTDFGTPLNPFGCWDWWGYTNFNYAVKAGRQVTTIKTMLDRLTSGYVQSRAASPTTNLAAPSDVVVNDVSDTGAAIAWKPLAGAQTYNVYRATSGNNNFAGLGSVSGPSFGDMGLRPATSYAYKVTATAVGSSEGPSSPVLTATTRPVPPRCDQPGTCLVP